MSLARLLLPLAVVGCFAGTTAKAEIFDHLSVSATPSTYEGHCPASIKLESVIKFDVSLNRQEQYVYRWESDDETLTDDFSGVSKGRTNRVETTILISKPAGTTATIPIRLHAMWGTEFGKTDAYLGKSVNDHYSLPVVVTVTCR